MKRIILFCLIFLVCNGCKKKYTYDVKYIVTIGNPSNSTNLPTEVDYHDEDNVVQKKIITSNNWEFNFSGIQGKSAWLKAINTSNLSPIQIQIIVNGEKFSDNCNTNNCEVILYRHFD